MSAPTEVWKTWEGKLVDGKFPLRQWIGGSDHSAVFVTNSRQAGSQKATIKLIPSTGFDTDAQLLRWAEAAKLSHPNLIRLFSYGRSEIEGTPVLYVVMDYADENLSEVLPVRPLSAEETIEMLRPASDGLAFLHQSGWVHGHIKPSNILAVNNQLKLSADGALRAHGHGYSRALDGYDAPEVSGGASTPASDVWSLGMTLLAVLSQIEPKLKSTTYQEVAVPETIPQPLHGIIQRCVLTDPEKRSSAKEIQRRLSPGLSQNEPTVSKKVSPADVPTAVSKRWRLIPVALVALILLIWAVSKFAGHRSPAIVSDSRPENSQQAAPATAPPESPTSSVPHLEAATRGSVLHQVMPDVSKNALRTIRGRIKVGVEVAVDSSGNVSDAKFSSPGPSRYFSTRSLEAARQWKFKAPEVNGQPVASDWRLLFQFGRSSAEVKPTELKP